MGGGDTDEEGYVEALGSNGEWGGLCDDGWGIQDAHVVCKMLGYPEADESFGSAKFGLAPSGNDFVLDDLGCTGSETNIFDCDHIGEWKHNCAASEIAGLRCAPLT